MIIITIFGFMDGMWNVHPLGFIIILAGFIYVIYKIKTCKNMEKIKCLIELFWSKISFIFWIIVGIFFSFTIKSIWFYLITGSIISYFITQKKQEKIGFNEREIKEMESNSFIFNKIFREKEIIRHRTMDLFFKDTFWVYLVIFSLLIMPILTSIQKKYKIEIISKQERLQQVYWNNK